MIELDPVEEIKRRLNVIEVISSYLPLKKAGKNFVALCPFHAEKKPSFTVSPDKQVWHCFGCGRGGDLFSFIMQKEGMDFAEALELLAERAGVTLERRPQERGIKKRILAANEAAANYFQARLKAPEGQIARGYLAKRALSSATAEKFRLGYAPREGLLEHLGSLNLSERELTDWGLAVERDGRLIDKFRQRIIFPISDHLGRIVAFTGRALSEADEPKYLNSPETPVFSKSQVLYGLDLTKEEIQKRDFAVLVEGQMDLLASYQSGVRNVTAVSGSAFTPEQAQLLRRYTDKLIFAFDNDEAGREAIRRSLPAASQAGFKIKVADLPEKDPDATIQKEPSLWATALKEAKSAVEFFLAQAKRSFGWETPLARQKVAEVAEEIIASLADPVEREIYIKLAAESLGVGEMALRETVKRRLEKSPAASLPPAPPIQVKTASFLERKLLALLVVFPINLPLFLPEVSGLAFSDPFCQKIYRQLTSFYTGEREENFSPALFLERLAEPERTRLAEAILIVEGEYENLDPEETRNEIAFYLRLLKDQKSREQRQELIERIAQAEARGDRTALKELLERLREK